MTPSEPVRTASCPNWCSDDHTDELASQLDARLGGFDMYDGTLLHRTVVGALPLGWTTSPRVDVAQEQRHEMWRERQVYLYADCPLTPADARQVACLLLEAARLAETVEGTDHLNRGDVL